MIIWDEGTHEVVERTDGIIVVNLAGAKLTGRYRLVHTGFGRGNGWLLIKSREENGGDSPSRGTRRAKKARLTRRAGSAREGGTRDS